MKWFYPVFHLICRASEHAFVFLRKGDDWGRMFSYVEMIAKIFPKTSDYDLLRKSALDMYASIKVIEVRPDHRGKLTRTPLPIIFFIFRFIESFRNSSTSNSNRLIQIMSVIFSTCTSKNWTRRKPKSRVHSVVSSESESEYDLQFVLIGRDSLQTISWFHCALIWSSQRWMQPR